MRTGDAELKDLGPKIGFIGLGLMGYPMATNLTGAGYDLTVFNRSPAKARALAAATGAKATGKISGIAATCDVVFTMLPGPPEVEAVISSVLTEAREGMLVVDMSTSSPVLARSLYARARERNIGVLDAPVSGGDVGAENGTLSIMVGGDVEDFERSRPLLDVLGNTVTHAGPSGSGQVVKAANQIVVALTIAAVSEALVLGERGGVAPEIVLDVLAGGLASNSVTEVKREKFLSGDFRPGGKVVSQLKDLGIALETGREYGVALPATAVVDQLYASLVASGDGDLDHSALIKVIRGLSG